MAKKKQIIYEFLYCDCIHESSYATLSLHKTKEGAEKAMKKHKEQEKEKFDKYYQSQAKRFKKEEEPKTAKILIKSLGTYDTHKDWQIGKQELLD